jgi:hypothetical protein
MIEELIKVTIRPRSFAAPRLRYAQGSLRNEFAYCQAPTAMVFAHCLDVRLNTMPSGTTMAARPPTAANPTRERPAVEEPNQAGLERRGLGQTRFREIASDASRSSGSRSREIWSTSHSPLGVMRGCRFARLPMTRHGWRA